jgi:eukaryotic-like serine/threonine-protein kinase
MTPERWHEIDRVFQAALEREPHERLAFLDEACSGDGDLRKEVEHLISCDVGDRCLVDAPAFDAAASFLALDEPVMSAGQQLSHYDIIELLGIGGMGEVYLAQDRRLGRKVALKLLPADFTRDQSRMRRFQQEARAASALNHPNILTIHDIGDLEGQYFIASEFIDGETLRQRLSQQRIPITEALDIAVQIASALSVARMAGIVHRDIKPENIMLRRDGYVKVLDFGLAKLTRQDEPRTEAGAPERSDISSGLLMGTVKYMSPEQTRGMSVDPRSDIFSFGVVLYEMLAGRTPFEGQTSSELIPAILKKQPSPLTGVPDEINRLVNRALRKRKEERYQTIEELLIDLKRIKGAGSGGVQMASATSYGSVLATSGAAAVSTSTFDYVVSGIRRHKTGTALVLASFAIVTFGTLLGVKRFGIRPRPPSIHVNVARIPNTDKVRSVAISPNGEYIAYAELSGTPVRPGKEQSLWVLQLATNRRTEIKPPADIDYNSLAYSPNGGDIFYVSNETLYRTPAGGREATMVLSDVTDAVSFAPDGAQFAFVRSSNSRDDLMVANVDGSGERVVATRKRPGLLRAPAWSPDGSLVACAFRSKPAKGQVSVIGFDVRTGEEKRVTDQRWDEVGEIIWRPDGSGLIAAAGQIWAIPYPTGEAQKITSDLNYGFLSLGLTGDGKNLIAIQSGFRSTLWLMPEGDPSAAKPITSGEYQDYRHVSWTTDGRILYASNAGTSRDIWIMNGDGTNPRQLTSDTEENLQPQPSGDGRYIVFTSTRANEDGNIWRMNIDGSNPVQLTHGSGESQPVCSPDGRWVVYSQGGVRSGPGEKTLWKVTIDGGEPVQLCNQPSMGADISRDGTLIACWYKQDSAPGWKIALLPFEGGPPIRLLDAKRTTIHPVRWSPDGQAIDFVNVLPFLGNISRQPVNEVPAKQITQFTSELILGFDWSLDGKLLCARRHTVQDAILIDFR